MPSATIQPMGKALAWMAFALLVPAMPAMAGTPQGCKNRDGVETIIGGNAGQRACGSAVPHTGGVAPIHANRAASQGRRVVPVMGSASTLRSAGLLSGRVQSATYPADIQPDSTTATLLPAARTRNPIRHAIFETCFACARNPAVDFQTLRLNTSAYSNDISRAALAHGIDEAIVRAVIHAESAFNPNALSRVGAQGLMQLMPGTARRFGVSNPFDAAQNIDGGVRYLAWLLKRFNGDLSLAAAGYNAGEGAVDRFKGVPPYSETRRYVERVALLTQRYRGLPPGAR